MKLSSMSWSSELETKSSWNSSPYTLVKVATPSPMDGLCCLRFPTPKTSLCASHRSLWQDVAFRRPQVGLFYCAVCAPSGPQTLCDMLSQVPIHGDPGVHKFEDQAPCGNRNRLIAFHRRGYGGPKATVLYATKVKITTPLFANIT